MLPRATYGSYYISDLRIHIFLDLEHLIDVLIFNMIIEVSLFGLTCLSSDQSSMIKVESFLVFFFFFIVGSNLVDISLLLLLKVKFLLIVLLELFTSKELLLLLQVLLFLFFLFLFIAIFGDVSIQELDNFVFPLFEFFLTHNRLLRLFSKVFWLCMSRGVNLAFIFKEFKVLLIRNILIFLMYILLVIQRNTRIVFIIQIISFLLVWVLGISVKFGQIQSWDSTSLRLMMSLVMFLIR